MKSDYLTPTEAAKILGLSRQAVIERIKAGSLYAERVGKRYIIPSNQLSAVANKEEKPAKISIPLDKKSKKEAIKKILEKVVKDNIKTIQLWFVDILGILADKMAHQNTLISCYLVSWSRFFSAIDYHLVFSNLDEKLVTVVATKVHAQVM